MDYRKRVIDLTLGELIEAVEDALDKRLGSRKEKKYEKRYVYGLKGLANLLGCSKTTAQRIKSSGVINEAITQVGALMIIDADLALSLAKKRKH